MDTQIVAVFCFCGDMLNMKAISEQLLPKHIQTVIARGFELKVALFILAGSSNYLVR